MLNLRNTPINTQNERTKGESNCSFIRDLGMIHAHSLFRKEKAIRYLN